MRSVAYTVITVHGAEKDARDFLMSTSRCMNQWNLPVFALGLWICSILEKDTNDFHMSTLRCMNQWNLPVFVLGLWICSILEKDTNDFHMSVLRCHM